MGALLISANSSKFENVKKRLFQGMEDVKQTLGNSDGRFGRMKVKSSWSSSSKSSLGFESCDVQNDKNVSFSFDEPHEIGKRDITPSCEY